MKKLLLILLLTFSFAGVVPVDQDVANHAFIGAGITKVVDAIAKDDGTTFWVMTAIFIGKELLDLDKTGFSINDLVYDYAGYFLVKGEIKF